MASGVPDGWQQRADGHGDSERRCAHAVALEGAGLTGGFRESQPDWSIPQLVCPDVACHSPWSSHTPLVGGDTIDMTGIRGDAMDGPTPWEQGMGLGWPFVVLQQRINPQSCG